MIIQLLIFIFRYFSLLYQKSNDQLQLSKEKETEQIKLIICDNLPYLYTVIIIIIIIIVIVIVIIIYFQQEQCIKT
jgi:uncharacterized membrane protein YkgB